MAHKVIIEEEHGARDMSIPKVIILVTDGKTTVNPLRVQERADWIKTAGIRIVAVSVHDGVSNSYFVVGLTLVVTIVS